MRDRSASIVVVGLSHRTAPVEVRERFAAASEALPLLLARLAARSEIAETLFLSTCNRVEVFARARAPMPETAFHAVREVLRDHAALSSHEELSGYLYERDGEEAVRHIFRVTASLESMVLGEPQILGQVKEAYDLAVEAGTLGNLLGRCVTRAFSVAKRVRTETALGAGTVSISSVAVDLARSIFGDLTGHSVLLVGAGEMAEAAAKSLGKGARSVRVCNRNFERAAQLAQTFGGTAAPLANLEEELVLSDVVVVSTASRDFVITRDLVKRAMKRRRGRTLFIVDISVPRNVDPEAHDVDNVFVYNVDDLESQVAEGLRARQGEAAAAEAIVAAELDEWRTWTRGLDVQPTIVGLRAKARAAMLGELDRSLAGKLRHLGEPERAALAQMVDSAVNKLLHGPTARLKSGDSAELVAAARALFDLRDDDPPTDGPKAHGEPTTERPPPPRSDEEQAVH